MSSDGPYYDCSESDHITHEDPEECLVDYFDGFYWPKEKDIKECIREACPITMVEYMRARIPPDWAEGFADNCVEWFEEQLNEEYGDPSGDHETLSGPDRGIAAEHFTVAAKAVVELASVWQLEEVSRFEYDYEQVLKIVKKECPHWFGEKK